MNTITIIEVPSELGAGTRGAAMGIDAIKAAARSEYKFLFQNYRSTRIKSQNELLDKPSKNPHAKYINGISEVGQSLCGAVKDEIVKNSFPIILSGDHSMAHASIAGLKSSMPDKRIGIIWIDAHADLHSPYTSPSGNMHGMPLAIAAAEDNIECKINEPVEKTKKLWENLKNLGVEGAKYDYQDLVFLGVRSTEKPERHLMEKHNILNLTVEECRENGMDWAIEQTKQRLADCDFVYISFDVDSMDPSLSRGTGTPVPGGFMLDEVVKLNSELVQWSKTRAWEMVEVNPVLDEVNKMGKLALNVLENVLRKLEG